MKTIVVDTDNNIIDYYDICIILKFYISKKRTS